MAEKKDDMESLSDLFKLLDRAPMLPDGFSGVAELKGDTVVFKDRRTGRPLLWMPKEVYDDILKIKKEK